MQQLANLTFTSNNSQNITDLKYTPKSAVMPLPQISEISRQ